MPEVTSTVRIEAPLEEVYLAAKDIEGLVEYIDDLESVVVLERNEVDGGLETTTAWVGLLPEFGRKVRWTERDRWDDAEHRCVFGQVEGDFDRYEGEWLFRQDGDATESTLIIRYEYDVPLIGPMIRRLVLKKVQDSADATQRGLERRMAAGAG